MRQNDIREIGMVTTTDEMVRLKPDLLQIWPQLELSHPVEAVEFLTTDENLEVIISRALNRIPGIERKNIILLPEPELRLIEAIRLAGLKAEIIIIVDSLFSKEAIERVENNVPEGLRVRVVQELPDRSLGPTNCIMMSLGFAAGYRYVLIPSMVAAVINRIRTTFAGERLLVDLADAPIHWRPGEVTKNYENAWVIERLDVLFTDVASVHDVFAEIS
jgi:hypothetical protein